MKYVFFDCECANCLNGEGKICSLGYVLTDTDFNILKKKDIIINPEAPFLLGDAKSGNGIKLAYPLFRFKWSHTFPFFYKEIMNLFTKEEIIAFGFAVRQDVSYLTYTCRRYNLPRIPFRFFDIQAFEKVLNHRKNPSGLDHLIEEFRLESFTYHESDDDALMTMEVFRKLLELNNLTVDEAINAYPTAFDDVDGFIKDEERRKKIKEEKRKKAKKVDDFYLQMEQIPSALGSYDERYWKKSIYLNYTLFLEEFEQLFALGKELKRRGATFVRNPSEADYIIIKPHNVLPNSMKTKKSVQIVRIDTLKKQFNK